MGSSIFYAATHKEFTDLCGPASKQRRINNFKMPSIYPNADFSALRGEVCDKYLVRCRPAQAGALNGNGF
jgi:hypothetical protein